MARPLRATESVSAEISRNLALELVRVTEAGALASARWMGRGDKNSADGAAVEAMRLSLGKIEMDGVVVIGAGGKDEAPMLYIGKRMRVSALSVVILDRPRHEGLIKEIREAGARIKLISDGDVAGALMTAIEGTGLDVLAGIGGATEAVLSACALKSLGGEIQCKLYARNPEEKAAAEAAGADFG